MVVRILLCAPVHTHMLHSPFMSCVNPAQVYDACQAQLACVVLETRLEKAGSKMNRETLTHL